jgi:hypothetical protein
MDIKTTLQASSFIIALSFIYAVIFSIEAGR